VFILIKDWLLVYICFVLHMYVKVYKYAQYIKKRFLLHTCKSRSLVFNFVEINFA
jgi:hypothetical protein